MPTTTSENCPVVQYVLDGATDTSAVAAGKARLVGVIVADQTGTTHRIDGLAQTRALLATPEFHRRIYIDAVQAQVIEHRFGLPAAEHFDDLRTCWKLLTLTDAPQGSAHAHTASSWSPRIAWQDAQQRLNDAIAALHEQPFASLAAQGLQHLYERIERPLTTVTASMIAGGVLIDRQVALLLPGYEEASQIATHEFKSFAGNVNPTHAQAVQCYLYDQCGLPRDGHGKRSLKLQYLAHFVRSNKAVEAYLTFAHLQPPLRTLRALSEAVHDDDRIYPQLDQLGTVTGRFTCIEPNLLGLADDQRSLVIAREGCVFIEADYSQMELRVLAGLSNDVQLLDALADPTTDIHCRTASVVLGKPESDISPEQRQRFGKAVNFAVTYGSTPQGLAQTAAVTVAEADQLIQAFFRRYPDVAGWMTNATNGLGFGGEVRSYFGRRRFVGGDAPSAIDHGTQIVSTLVQGTSADLFKLAMLKVSARLPQGCRIVLPLHDAVLVEVPLELADVAEEILRTEMQEPCDDFATPLFVECRRGSAWA